MQLRTIVWTKKVKFIRKLEGIVSINANDLDFVMLGPGFIKCLIARGIQFIFKPSITSEIDLRL